MDEKMVVLFHVDLKSGDVKSYEVHSDGTLRYKGREMYKTGFRLVNDHVEYLLREIPSTWLNRMNAAGHPLLPLEVYAYQEDGFCDNALWTRDMRRARDTGRLCTFVKEEVLKNPTRIY